MASHTAARWFAGNDDFFNNRADYAFPGIHSAEITRHLRRWDFRLYDELPWTYYGYVRASDSRPCYACAAPGALVFADVIGTDEHRELLKNLRAGHELTIDEIVGFTQQERQLGDQLAPIYNSNPQRDPDVPVVNEENAISQKDLLRLKQSFQMDGAYLHPEIVSSVLKRRTDKDKAAVLDLYSGEVLSKLPRPTLMIIEMFDEAKATSCGESSGYVIAYDFMTNQVIIKHWTSSLDHRPLEDPWFAPPQNDGVSFLGSPSDLLHQIVTRTGLVKDSPTYGFGLLTRFMAGRWLSWYFDQLGLSSTAAAGYDHAHLKSTMSSYAAELATLDVPGVETDSEGRKKRTNYRKPRSDAQGVYLEVLDYIESREVELAEIALDERDAGKSVIADNLARFYDGVSRAANSLLVDPETYFSFESWVW